MKRLLLSSLLSLTPLCSFAESQAEFDARMQWWDDGRLGMFLHWGVYSELGGEYRNMDHGKEMGGMSAEWIYMAGGVNEEDYQAAAQRFKAEAYDPVEWVRLAKDAGMKYMVLTTKHHDGFALFDTEASEWNAVDASGAKRDLIREYVDACHAADMKVGFYYSHEKDWKHHGRGKNSDSVPEAYETLVLTQMRELLTNYGKIDLIWYDLPSRKHGEFNEQCAAIVRELQPHCILNGRTGRDRNGEPLGDYQNIGDRVLVAPGASGYMESIMTMRLNWGYDRNDDFWKPAHELIRMVCKSASRGSNFLLNVGPTPEGPFPSEDVERIEALGAWMEKNSEAIHATKSGPYGYEHEWGSFTIGKDRNKLYLFPWNPEGASITLKGLTSPIQSASFLDDGSKVSFTQDRANALTQFELPAGLNAQNIRVIAIELESQPEFDLEKGPSYQPAKVAHHNHNNLLGELTELSDTHFTLHGRATRRRDLENRRFVIPENCRYRTNTAGDIQLVDTFPLETGKQYRITWTKDGEDSLPVIITQFIQ
jgi:alpha-L-fucosidase